MTDMTTETTTEKAFDFLCKRNPLDVNQITYVLLLMEFQDYKGDEAIEALAGFYLYAIENKLPRHEIAGTFAHDLSGRKDEWCEPRSSDYRQFWKP
jgi:hypothetical protein